MPVRSDGSDPPRGRWVQWFGVLSLTVVGLALLGYHPYAEDGGIYAAALAARMDPGLFAHDGVWVRGHTRLSVFVPVLAGVAQILHVPVAWALLLVQVASFAGFVAAVWAMAQECLRRRVTAVWTTVLVVAAAGVPVAGTSLYLLDPYATARSVTTPLLLGTAVLALQRRWWAAAVCWGVAAAMHPLMAMWSGVVLVLLATPGRWRAGVCAGMLGTLGAMLAMSPADSAAVHAVALTRGYWFLSEWRWYESVGVIAPLVLLGWMCAVKPRAWTEAGRRLGQAVLVGGTMAVSAALLFAREGARSSAVARLQPLRTFHFVYAAFLLLLAGEVTERVRRRAGKIGLAGAAVAVALSLVGMQRGLYRASGWVEWPGAMPRNGWEQAFLWARDHTTRDAVFALDARYTELAGEDAQGFRAVALRAVLPDAAKDGGVAAVMPELAGAWAAGMRAQQGLEGATDERRRARLLPLGVGWIVLGTGAETVLECPYANDTAKVCRLR